METYSIDRISFLLRLEDLKKRYLDELNYADLNIFGVYQNANGVPSISVFRELALQNAIKLWIFSYSGDYYREPEKGGILSYLLGTPMDEENKIYLQNFIQTKFESEIYYAELVDLKIDINYELRTWILSFHVLDLVTNTMVDFDMNIQI